MTVTKETPKTPDLEAILPDPTAYEVEGIPANVKRLKSREFLALLRVITNGAGAHMGSFDFSGDSDEVSGKLVGLAIVAIPNAAEEFTDLLQLVVEPKNRSDANALSKALQNPDIDVLLDVITIIAEQEKDDLTELVGKARAALTKIQSLYQRRG